MNLKQCDAIDLFKRILTRTLCRIRYGQPIDLFSDKIRERVAIVLRRTIRPVLADTQFNEASGDGSGYIRYVE